MAQQEEKKSPIDFHEPTTKNQNKFSKEREEKPTSTYAFLNKYQITSIASNFQVVDKVKFFKQNPANEESNRTYAFSSFETPIVIGEGTYGKVYKAKLRNDPFKELEYELTKIKVTTTGSEKMVMDKASNNHNNFQQSTNREEIAKLNAPENYRALKRLKLKDEHDGFPITSLREILILRRLNHPNIVSLLDVFRQEKRKAMTDWKKNQIYLVFEFIPHDLTGLIDYRLKWSPAQLKCILKQILEGLAYLHRNNYLHRDLKGSNVLVSRKGEVKLCDFGLAKYVDSAKQRQMTTHVVTRWYRAPELFLGDRFYSSKIDVWSVGCIFAELLTEGKAPFRGGNDDETFKLIAQRCQFPSKEEWPELVKMPNYKAYSRTMYPNRQVLKPLFESNMQSPTFTVGSDASTVNSP